MAAVLSRALSRALAGRKTVIIVIEIECESKVAGERRERFLKHPTGRTAGDGERIPRQRSFRPLTPVRHVVDALLEGADDATLGRTGQYLILCALIRPFLSRRRCDSRFSAFAPIGMRDLLRDSGVI